MQLLVFVAPFLIGLYREWLSCLAAVYLLGYLLYCRIKSGELRLPKNMTTLACVTIVGFFAFSPIWAVDKGMAVFGLVKFLPLPLFSMAIAQTEPEQRRHMIDLLPLSGAVMTVLTAALCAIPFLRQYLVTSGRLGGFFQYPNTFAIFLLVGLVIAILGGSFRVKTVVICGVLLLGILASGSRTVFLLMIVSLIVYMIFSKNKRVKLFLLCGFGAAILATSVYAAVSGNFDTIARYLTSSLTSSTFVGRILYDIDALPVILKHPLGLGYMGYYFTQGSFQSGVYTVLNVHNELLQILLDIGWIPAAVCIAALWKAIRTCDARRRVILILLVAHSLLDFDFQFLAIDLILLLVADCENDEYMAAKGLAAPCAVGVVSMALAFYFGIANAAEYFNARGVAASIYPAYTTVYIAQLPEAESMQETGEIAERILALNEQVSLAHSAKARAAFANGDILQMIESKKQAIALAKYSLAEYRDYYNMLEIAAGLYDNAGDSRSAAYCRTCMSEIPQMLEEVKKETSSLAWMIDDKPELEWGE